VENDLVWRRSTRSGANADNCVEVATPSDQDRVLVRDSKDVTGPVLSVTRTEWRAFVASLR
jgi:hypothetical protein